MGSAVYPPCRAAFILFSFSLPHRSRKQFRDLSFFVPKKYTVAGVFESFTGSQLKSSDYY
jgi:hypothetical protein